MYFAVSRTPDSLSYTRILFARLSHSPARARHTHCGAPPLACHTSIHAELTSAGPLSLGRWRPTRKDSFRL